MSDAISFPGLGFSFDPPRIAFELFGRGIYWYGIILAAAFLVAAIYCIKRAPKFGITSDDLTDVMIFATPMAIIGARLYYVAFQWSYFEDDPISILYIWDGGVAIYGAIIGAVITALIVCTIKRINIAAVLDIGSLGLLIGQAIGRWGNFINREAYGNLTDLPWRMEILIQNDRYLSEGTRQAVHPTFLYESLWNILGFILLHNFYKKRKYNGQVFLMYIAWYGFGRAIIEGLRTDSLLLTSTLRASQVLGYATCIIALILLFYNFVFKRHDPSKLLDLTAFVPEPMVPAEIIEESDTDTLADSEQNGNEPEETATEQSCETGGMKSDKDEEIPPEQDAETDLTDPDKEKPVTDEGSISEGE